MQTQSLPKFLANCVLPTTQWCTQIRWRHDSQVPSLKTSKDKLKPYQHKTGRGWSNVFLPGDMPRIRLANSKMFTRTICRTGLVNASLEDMKLLLEAGSSPKSRVLGDKKRRKLSAVFMQNLFQIISESDRFESFENFQLSRVDVTVNYREIRVYWLMKGDETDEITTKSLEMSKDFVRRRLAETLGNTNIPRIVFVGERDHLLVQEMNRLFEKADYGMQYRAVSETGAIFGSMSDPGPSAQRQLSPIEQRNSHSDTEKPSSSTDC